MLHINIKSKKESLAHLNVVIVISRTKFFIFLFLYRALLKYSVFRQNTLSSTLFLQSSMFSFIKIKIESIKIDSLWLTSNVTNNLSSISSPTCTNGVNLGFKLCFVFLVSDKDTENAKNTGIYHQVMQYIS